MAVPAIVWRNPNFERRRRRWINVRREGDRSLYMVVESVSMYQNTWDGLPTLEIVQGRAVAPSKAAANLHPQSGT